MSVAAVLFVLAAVAGPVQAVHFVTCPVYRDTDAGKKSGCWLADDPVTGIRYDVSLAPTKPDWNFAVLVEGVPAKTDVNPCGGKVLEPVRVSVLDQACTRFMLEAERYTGRKFALPKHNVRPLYEEREKQIKPFETRNFSIPFDFDSSFVTYQGGDYYLDALINYALEVQPANIQISGHAQTAPIHVSGQTLVEAPDVAKARLDVVRRALILRGIDPARVTIEPALAEPASLDPFDGLQWPVERRVDARVEPTASLEKGAIRR